MIHQRTVGPSEAPGQRFIGQGRYLDRDGNVLTSEELPPVVEAPRIFA